MENPELQAHEFINLETGAVETVFLTSEQFSAYLKWEFGIGQYHFDWEEQEEEEG